MTKIVTRFAPSPTGYLHIGSARTALFNYLFSRHNKGDFLLRIEDTDRLRSTEIAVKTILESLKWLELEWDGEVVYQSSRIKRHQEVVEELIAKDKAYYCYQTQEETEALKQEAKEKGQIYQYDKKWRDKSLTPREGIKPVVRLKTDEDNTLINDLVQGDVSFSGDQLDDMVLLRSDGTPTYMLAVVVDDHDMGITHVIRGDDHLSNTPRQIQIYKALNWVVPEFAHIPLIHGEDGAKLSKRHGALGVESYKEMGYLKETICNYLLRLGWSHGDDEIIDKDQAIAWFDLEHIGKSPSRLDFKKLENLNLHYIKGKTNLELFELIKDLIEKKIGYALDKRKSDIIILAIEEYKQRAKTVVALADSLINFIEKPKLDTESINNFDIELIKNLKELSKLVSEINVWSEESIKNIFQNFIELNDLKLNIIGQALRIIILGTKDAPGIYKIMSIIGKDETLERINNFLESNHA